MAVDFNVVEHGVAYPANLVSQRYGNHVLHIKLTSNTDNGNFVGVGDYIDMNTYKEGTATKCTGYVGDKRSDGLWDVVITDPGDALFVYQKPLSPYGEPLELTQEKAFFNETGDVVRAYVMTPYDHIALSDADFSGTAKKGATFTTVTNKKLVIATA
jgi:hypothetical protein